MRTLQLAGSLLAFAAAFAAYGCALDVSGLDETTPSTGGAGPTSASVGPGGGATSTGNTVTSVATGCPQTVEDCDDGMDNNCDGLIDCADPQCKGSPTGRECVEPAPTGWTAVAFAPNAATCPEGYDSPAVVASAPGSAAAECTCNCGQAPSNPCLQGTLTIKMGLMGCGGYTFTPMVTGGCDALGGKVSAGYKTGSAEVLQPKPPLTCSATPVLPAAQPSSSGVTCSSLPSDAGGCESGSACLPKLMSAKRCIQSPGDNPCPSGPFTNRQVVGAVGDTMDQRTCGACSCTSSATTCSNGLFTGYDDTNCTQHPVSVQLDGTCHAVNTSSFMNNDHFKYQATPNTMDCAPSGAPSMLNGSFKLNNPITICCLP